MDVAQIRFWSHVDTGGVCWLWTAGRFPDGYGVFNIDGMGYLGYTSILQRDYPVALGILVIGSLLMLIGNILSDVIYAVVDPRIRFR